MSETAPLYRQMFRLDTKKPPPKKPPPRSERYRLARPWTGSGLRARMRHHDGRAARRPGPPPKSQSWRGGRRGGPCNRRPGAPCPQVGVNYQLPSELSLAVSRLAKEPGLGSPTYRAPTGGWGRWHGYDRMHGRRCGGYTPRFRRFERLGVRRQNSSPVLRVCARGRWAFAAPGSQSRRAVELANDRRPKLTHVNLFRRSVGTCSTAR